MRFLFLPFVLLPVLEIMVFIKIGEAIGALNTVIFVILGSMLGMTIIRRQGFRTMLNARAQMAHGELPAQGMLEGFLVALGGVLLVLPGFITDAVGLTLQIPFIRRRILRNMLASSRWQVRETGIYEGEYRREGEPKGAAGESPRTIEGEVIQDIAPEYERKNEKK